MDVSGTSAAAATSSTVAIEVQKKSQDIAEQTASDLIASVPDPDSSVGQNIDVMA